MMKKCVRCGQEKDRGQFHKNSQTKDKLISWCKDCCRERAKQPDYKAKQKVWNDKYTKTQEYKDAQRDKHYAKRFGITLSAYNLKFNSQLGLCGICGRHQMNYAQRFHVDHDHSTGKVRDLLCNNCNVGLGNFRDKIEYLKAAISYLERHREE